MSTRKHKVIRKPAGQQGFTIVELMIATMVFSVILTVITAGVISFTNRYYKGVNVASTQTTTRSIMDTIGQAIQFGASSVQETGTNSYFCAGGYEFVYGKGVKYDGTSTTTGLQMAPIDSGGCDGTLGSGGEQLLGKNMRLTTLSVTQVSSGSNLYKIELGIAYGDDDLLCSPSVGNCTDKVLNFWDGNIRCRSSAGTQFCATSKLTTVVAKRV